MIGIEEVSMAKEVTKDMYIGEVLQIDPGLAGILMEAGMHCLGCPSSQRESVEDAALVHGFNADELVKKLNAYLSSAE
jgi:hybrid cluster-associated redox disulfide protein